MPGIAFTRYFWEEYTNIQIIYSYLSSFMLLNRTLISRTFLPRTFISNNVKTFKSNEVKYLIFGLNIKWNFILEKFP